MVKSRKVLKVLSGWEAVEILLKCLFVGFWQFLKMSFIQLWKGHRRKLFRNVPPVELTEDSSVGTHYYIKIMGVKYHYVETGPKTGHVVLVLGDAPEATLLNTPTWSSVVRSLTENDHRVITLDLRGSGGSESGSRVDLSPPRVVEELCTLLKALKVSEGSPAVVIGHGIGGMLAWYLAHCSGEVVNKLVVIDAPHPSLYWQFPPTGFCANALHFIQFPYLPERWLADTEASPEPNSDCNKWANSRASDWTGALNYVRGAAWWQIAPSSRVTSPALLIGRGSSAAQLVSSAQHCAVPTLRIITTDEDLLPVMVDYLIARDKELYSGKEAQRRGIVGRVFGAVAGRGRELSAMLLPPTPA